MKFEIYKTSNCCGDKPCEGAKYFEGPIEIKEHWLSKRTYESQVTYWYTEINTLEELIKFSNDNGGRIIIETNDERPSIEIYDDYRE